jgi:hypothetical protein
MPQPCINLVVQYFNDRQPQRAAEYDQCVARNLANPWIKSVSSLTEPQTKLPDEFTRHSKFRSQVIARRLTFRAALEFASGNFPDETVCLANLDIFLDATSDWSQAAQMTHGPIVLCLSRIEFNPDGTTFKDPSLDRIAFRNAQDAWVFRAPIDVLNCDFEVGTLGGDNAFAHRLKCAGKIPVNAADRFRIFHFDRVRGKTHANQAEVHRAGGAAGSRPQREGHYLLPNIDQVKSVDAVLDSLNVSELQRYVLICDILSHAIQIKND